MNTINTINTIKTQAYTLYQTLKQLEDELATPDTPKSDLDLIRDAVQAENFVILDTETTGLHDGEIIEIAIINHEGKTLMNQRIKPHGDIPEASSNIHGIYLEDVILCQHFEDVVTQIKGHLAGKDVIVYNATYDRKMLHKSAEHAGIERINWKSFSRWLCAMEAFSPIYGEWNHRYGNYRWQKLTTAAAYYDITVENAHSALGDCRMTLDVVRAMVKQ